MDIPGFDSLVIFLVTFVLVREAVTRFRMIRLSQRLAAQAAAKA